MDLGLAGRTALVGGASAGLGRASAERLAAEGCRLALWSRGGEALERAAGEIRRAHSAEVATIGGDAADASTAALVAAAAEKALGRVDIVVLNAGGPPTSEATKTDPEEWRRSFQLLAITPIELTTLLLPGMRARKWGRVVSIMSSGIRQPIPELSYSNACRSALAAWLKTISPEVMADAVTVNGVLPGRLDTARVASLDRTRAERSGSSPEDVRAQFERAIPAGRYGDPDELGAYVAWLCSDLARYQTGTFVPIDGGSLRALP
ncbi:MAG: SDR family oxidoreductase [Candidatus Limnocylindrales bacterium]|jgi:3-oxoacyl-[acyl-carrier protein] reductase